MFGSRKKYAKDEVLGVMAVYKQGFLDGSMMYNKRRKAVLVWDEVKDSCFKSFERFVGIKDKRRSKENRNVKGRSTKVSTAKKPNSSRSR